MPRPRFISFWRRARRVLGLNARNLLYVHGLNRRRHFPLADDKVASKQFLARAGVPTPETVAVLSNLAEVARCRNLLEERRDFALKPARGRQGSGIVVVTGRENGLFRRIDGTLLPWESLRRLMGDILFGVHSYGHSDRVLVEHRIQPLSSLSAMSRFGLPDIRIILLLSLPVMAMMRVPRRSSGGRANLHHGALGVAVRLRDGLAFRCVAHRRAVGVHPDTGAVMTGFHVPLWQEVLTVARRVGESVPLPYLGVDIVLDEKAGPLVMEINARPGLEIQNVNGCGLRRRLERVGAQRSGVDRRSVARPLEDRV